LEPPTSPETDGGRLPNLAPSKAGFFNSPTRQRCQARLAPSADHRGRRGAARRQDLDDRLLEPGMVVGDDELDA
jgi:hypothetical protein